jgi:NADPH:quinone reductase
MIIQQDLPATPMTFVILYKIMSMMRTIQFKQAGAAAEVLFTADHEKPLLTNDDVIVKVMARPINPSDFMFIQGQYRFKPVFPQIAGLEGSGIIDSTGGSVKGFRPGDHVAFRGIGTWADFVSVETGSLIKIDRDIPFVQSSQIALNPVTAFALLEQSTAGSNDFLLLSAGNSALATLIIQLAKEKGIRVICLVRNADKNEALLRLGAMAVIQQDDPELQVIIAELTGEAGITAFLDAVGGKLLSKCIKMMRPNGTIILYGRYDPAAAELYNADVVYKNLIIKGFGIAQWLKGKSTTQKDEVFKILINGIADKKLVLPEARLYELEDYKTAIEEDINKKSGKIVLISS